MAAKRITHWRRVLKPASGGAQFEDNSKKCIRFVRMGCANRPFYHIVVAESKKDQHMPVIEQVGSYDPMPNYKNEKLVAFNYERIQFWMAKGAEFSVPVAELLGLAGFLPIHPTTYMTAWRNRAKSLEAEKKEETLAQ